MYFRAWLYSRHVTGANYDLGTYFWLFSLALQRSMLEKVEQLLFRAHMRSFFFAWAIKRSKYSTRELKWPTENTISKYVFSEITQML